MELVQGSVRVEESEVEGVDFSWGRESIDHREVLVDGPDSGVEVDCLS